MSRLSLFKITNFLPQTSGKNASDKEAIDKFNIFEHVHDVKRQQFIFGNNLTGTNRVTVGIVFKYSQTSVEIDSKNEDKPCKTISFIYSCSTSSKNHLPMIEKTRAKFAFFSDRKDMHFWTDAWLVHNNDVQ